MGAAFLNDTVNSLERLGKADRRSSPINTETRTGSTEVSEIGIPAQSPCPLNHQSTKTPPFWTLLNRSIRISASSLKDSTIEQHRSQLQRTFPARPTSSRRWATHTTP